MARGSDRRGSPKSAHVEIPVRALNLLGVWRRVGQGHIPVGAGCSCGGGIGSVAVAEVEQDVIAFLRIRHPAFEPWLVAASDTPMFTLLAALARPGAVQAPVAAQRALLDDLSRTIESFERAHAGL